MFDYQFVYDHVRVALILQGQKATASGDSTGSCVYRTASGNVRCAMGHTIPDEFYFPAMEGLSALNLLANHPLLCGHWDLEFSAVRKARYGNADDEAQFVQQEFSDIAAGDKSNVDLSPVRFLQDLQEVHDSHGVEQWPVLLINLAKQWNLRP